MAAQSFACDTGKVCYSRAEARRALSQTMRRRRAGNKNRHESRIYECHRCSLWHLSS